METTFEKRSSAEELARSAAYAMLACALRYPEHEDWARLRDRSRWGEWPEILAESGEQVRDTLRHVQERLFSPDPERGGVTLEEAQSAYVRLFGHTAKGPCPMYELEYGGGEIFARSADLSDLKGFYEAFGLQLVDGAHERADHITIELEFLSALASKQAYASEHDDETGLEILADAYRAFLEAHVGHWLPSFVHRIGEAAPGSFHAALADFARAFIECECRRFGAEIGPAMLELRPTNEREETIQACAVEDFGGSCPMHAEEAEDA